MSAISNVDNLISAYSGANDITYYYANNMLSEAVSTAVASVDTTPVVQAVYSNTMIYYLNMVMTISYVSVMPFIWFIWFRVGDYFTKGNVVTNLAWMLLHFILVIYSALLLVGSESIQRSLLSSAFYVKGVIQALLLMNTTGFIVTMLYWFSTIEDRYAIQRDKLGQNAFDLLNW